MTPAKHDHAGVITRHRHRVNDDENRALRATWELCVALLLDESLDGGYGATCTCARPPVTKGGSPEKIDENAFVG